MVFSDEVQGIVHIELPYFVRIFYTIRGTYMNRIHNKESGKWGQDVGGTFPFFLFTQRKAKWYVHWLKTQGLQIHHLSNLRLVT